MNPEDLPELAPGEADTTPIPGWPQWLGLAVWGYRMPIPDETIRQMKYLWQQLPDEAARQLALERAKRQYDEMRTSAINILARLTIIGALATIATQIVEKVLSKNHGAGLPATWMAIVCVVCSAIFMLLMLTPKLKLWKRFNANRAHVGLNILKNIDDGWNEFLRLSKRIEQRQQLTRLERRLQSLAIAFICAAYILWPIGLALG